MLLDTLIGEVGAEQRRALRIDGMGISAEACPVDEGMIVRNEHVVDEITGHDDRLVGVDKGLYLLLVSGDGGASDDDQEIGAEVPIEIDGSGDGDIGLDFWGCFLPLEGPDYLS